MFLLIAVLFVTEIGALYLNSGYQEGLNKRADLYKKVAVLEVDVATIAAGDILDRNQTTLVKNEVNAESTYIDDYAYTQVIGFNGNRSVVIKEDEVEVGKSKKVYRLMDYYNDILYYTSNINSTKGSSLTLTLDHELQMYVQELMIQELGLQEEDNTLGLQAKGSAIVMDAKTGEILAMVSYPSLNANTANASIDLLNDSALQELELRYPISHKGQVVPGSIFKIIMAVCMLDHGMEAFEAEDSNFMIGDVPIVNDYGSMGDMLNYYDAIERSSNVFFAQAALEMGGEAINETASKFMLDREIKLDFGTISKNWNLDLSDEVNLAHTAFGQGKTLFSTMMAAMVTQAIANDGVMLKPYMVSQITDSDGNLISEFVDEEGETIQIGQTQMLSEVTSKETADKVTAAMVAATEDHIRIVEGESARSVYQTYNIASKTGTGENGDDTNNAWFISFAPADDPQYVVVVNQCNTSKYGYRMMDTAAEIYRYLFE